MLLIDKIAIAAIIVGILVFTACMIGLDKYIELSKGDKAPRDFR